MDKNMRCPMCDMSNFKEGNGNYVCQICGYKIPATNNDSKPEPTEADKKKPSFTINSFIIGEIILGILGVFIFLVWSIWQSVFL